MYTISKTFSFCYGHRLFRDAGKCGHPHGHTAKVTFVLKRHKVDEMGMVMHFDRLKETLGAWIGEQLDHNMLLCEEDPLAELFEKAGERHLRLHANPTAENLARLLFEKAREFSLPIARVEFWESETSQATYAETSPGMTP